MQPGVLRALEFDRIVEAVRGFALTPMGDERLARLAAVDRSAEGRAAAGGDDRDGRAIIDAERRASAARVGRPAADSRRARRRGPGARSDCGCWRSPAFLESVDETRAAHPPRRRHRSRCSTRRARGAASFKGEIAQTREKIDPSGEVRRPREPRAEDHPRAPAQAAHAAARHARVVPARQGHGEVPAGSGRHRAQRPLRAGRQDRAPRAAFPASCTARRRAARACSSSRSARSRSTTTSSRSRSRRPRRSAASCWR